MTSGPPSAWLAAILVAAYAFAIAIYRRKVS